MMDKRVNRQKRVHQHVDMFLCVMCCISSYFVVLFQTVTLSGHEGAFSPLPQLHPPVTERRGPGLRLHLRDVRMYTVQFNLSCGVRDKRIFLHLF